MSTLTSVGPVRCGRGGRRPAWVRFKEEEKLFKSSVEAFLFLAEKMFAFQPSFLLGEKAQSHYLFEGRGRRYFAKSPQDLFFSSPDLADNPANYRRLSNEWYVNLNASSDRKMKILSLLGSAIGLQEGKDWEFKSVEPSIGVKNLEDKRVAGRRLVEKLRQRLSKRS